MLESDIQSMVAELNAEYPLLIIGIIIITLVLMLVVSYKYIKTNPQT